MTQLTWDQVGEKVYETGIDRGVLFIPDGGGNYSTGVAWNGLVSITETPSGAEENAQYADNIKYISLRSAEDFGATLEAFTYPDEFAQFDGLATPTPGVSVAQQGRKSFGLAYRSKIGNDVDGEDHAYKIHLAYGLTASPSEKVYSTINDSPEAATFSWELSAVPVPVTGLKPTALVTIDSRDVTPEALAALEQLIYGTPGDDPQLPMPDAVITLFSDTITEATPTEPSFNSGTNTITIPSITGVVYSVDGVEVPAGALVISEDTIVTASPAVGYVFPPYVDTDWAYVYND